ncbi:DUF3791 domain-containing protein [Bifidobacterium jacchi]|uniref:DUF3791 domain-containing protein n=1 Tax=Bifidobacterium jacchi TaxID=2490545 RepID=A0A5N5RDQ5_9BIFI|nr:DUF3791 domain-containing protein [Bifidobacterium jacchi]
MTREMSFFIYLLEQYAGDKGRSASDVLREWDEHGVTQEIYDMYEMYHQESICNAYEDIDHLVATGKHKW